MFPSPAGLAVLMGLIIAATATFFIYSKLYGEETAACYITGIEVALIPIGLIADELIKGPKGTIIKYALVAIDVFFIYKADGASVSDCI